MIITLRRSTIKSKKHNRSRNERIPEKSFSQKANQSDRLHSSDMNACQADRLVSVRHLRKLNFLSKKLYDIKVLPNCSLEYLVKQVVCDPKRKRCMYGECSICKQKTLIGPQEIFNDRTSWYQWSSVKETREIQGKKGSYSYKKVIRIWNNSRFG